MRTRNPRLPVVCFDGIGRSERKNELSRLARFGHRNARSDRLRSGAISEKSARTIAAACPELAHEVKVT